MNSLEDKGKPQDGIVSRHFNRPISRRVTRLLLRAPITPTGWTLLILIFPVAGALLVTRGNYFGFVTGTLLYQIHSILDGCDGEIARARHLESDVGKRIDNWCDHAATILLVICLGIGLRRQIYFGEGIAVGILLAANEFMLAGSASTANTKSADPALYPRHREMVAGIPWLGAGTIGWLVQLTKRDVAILIFFLLALLGCPQWILHLLGLFGLVTLTLAGKTRFQRTQL